MTTLTDLFHPHALYHGINMEEPKKTFRGWNLLDGKNEALGLDVDKPPRNAMTLAGWAEETADCAFVVERMK